MADPATAIGEPNPQFNFDWETVEQGVPISTLFAFAKYSSVGIKDLLLAVIPGRTVEAPPAAPGASARG